MRARVQNTLQTDTALFKQAHSIFSFCFFPLEADLGIYFILSLNFDLTWPARAWGRHRLYIFWVFFCFFHFFIFSFLPL